MVFLLDETSEIRFAGPSCLRILGYTPEELVGQGCFALIHPEDQASTRREMAALIDDPGGSRTSEFRLLARDGSWHWIEGVGTNLLSDPSIQAIVIKMKMRKKARSIVLFLVHHGDVLAASLLEQSQGVVFVKARIARLER